MSNEHLRVETNSGYLTKALHLNDISIKWEAISCASFSIDHRLLAPYQLIDNLPFPGFVP